MTIRAVIGGQWGDEGKGKIVDFLSDEADVVVRFHGSSNAGHTVVRNGEIYKLHLLPSGIVSGRICVIGPGVNVDPSGLLDEIKKISNRSTGSVSVSQKNLVISQRAHIVIPLEILVDNLTNKVGTTNKGNGPCYANKMYRTGLRFSDTDERIMEEIQLGLSQIQNFQTGDNKAKIALKDYLLKLTRELPENVRNLRLFVRDIFEFYDEINIVQNNVLLEGAHGSLLDIDFGTYPFASSSRISDYGLSGINPRKIEEVIGVFKAYTTKVGEGPFPAEQNNELGDLLRKNGIEFGTTTERPRRCGWFDASAAQYAMRFCHFDSLAITKIDVLTGINPIKICVGYELDGNRLKSFPANADDLKKVTPIYIDMPGWKEFPQKIESLNDLPKEAVIYLNKISELLEDLPIKYVSYSPETKGTLVLKDFSYFQPGRVFH